MTKRERTTEDYRRAGGYQGPMKLKIIDVVCSVCQARPGEPCQGAKGPIKRPHAERSAFAADLNERAAAMTSTGRWYRHQFRKGIIPEPTKPCGTFAAYQRHRRNDEEVDDACQEAAREYWRKRKQSA